MADALAPGMAVLGPGHALKPSLAASFSRRAKLTYAPQPRRSSRPLRPAPGPAATGRLRADDASAVATARSAPALAHFEPAYYVDERRPGRPAGRERVLLRTAVISRGRIEVHAVGRARGWAKVVVLVRACTSTRMGGFPPR